MKFTKSEWILFIDADVELDKNTLKRALKHSIEEEIDLLSLAPRIHCSCLAEWMVQPIIAILLAIGFPIEKRLKNTKNHSYFCRLPPLKCF